MRLAAVLVLAVELAAHAGLTAGADEPRLSLVGGPRRAFGGTTITRTFKIEGEGAYDLAWESSLFRGIVNRGERKVDAPGNVKIDMDLPEVRARVEMVQRVQLKRDGQVLAEGNFVLGLFPVDALQEYGRMTAEVAPMGLCDSEKVIAPILEKAGIKYTLLETNLQAQVLESKLVMVAPNQADAPAEPMGGIRDLLEHGGTVIFLEPNSPQLDFFDPHNKPVKFVEKISSSAKQLVGEKHILLRNLLQGDLTDWAGSGEVASRALAWPECAAYQAWLSGGEAKDALPLVALYWGENGRLIVCQLEVGSRLAQEPVAHLVLRNLLSYAREVPVPAQARLARFAVPPEALADGKFNTARFVREPKAEDLKGAAGLLVLALAKGDESALAPGFDLGKYLAEGGKLFVQSGFGPEFVYALNQLARSAWPDKPNLPLPRFVAASVEDKTDVQLRYAKPLVWGISAEDFQQSLGGVEDRRCLKAEPGVPQFAPLAEPGFLVEFRRDKSRLILCALPAGEPENELRARVVRQIVANMMLKEDPNAP